MERQIIVHANPSCAPTLAIGVVFQRSGWAVPLCNVREKGIRRVGLEIRYMSHEKEGRVALSYAIEKGKTKVEPPLPS